MNNLADIEAALRRLQPAAPPAPVAAALRTLTQSRAAGAPTPSLLARFLAGLRGPVMTRLALATVVVMAATGVITTNNPTPAAAVAKGSQVIVIDVPLTREPVGAPIEVGGQLVQFTREAWLERTIVTTAGGRVLSADTVARARLHPIAITTF